LLAFNSNARILSAIDRALGRTDGELLVIDDGSNDGTPERVTERMLKETRLNLVARPARQGVTSATLAGFAYALQHGFDLLVTMTADDDESANGIPDIVQAAEQGAQVVVGSRYGPAGSLLGPRLPFRALGSRLSSWWLRLPVSDTTNPFRAWTSRVMQFLAANPPKERGDGGLTELLVAAHRAGFSLVEIPIRTLTRPDGS
jgi:dolichol-phosphate mannosyltransferase